MVAGGSPVPLPPRPRAPRPLFPVSSPLQPTPWACCSLAWSSGMAFGSGVLAGSLSNGAVLHPRQILLGWGEKEPEEERKARLGMEGSGEQEFKLSNTNKSRSFCSDAPPSSCRGAGGDEAPAGATRHLCPATCPRPRRVLQVPDLRGGGWQLKAKASPCRRGWQKTSCWRRQRHLDVKKEKRARKVGGFRRS